MITRTRVNVAMNPRQPKFKLGECYITPGAEQAIADSGDDPATYLRRHQSGDWGEMCSEDSKLNDQGCAREGTDHTTRLHSEYRLRGGKRIWIMTEWDRSATTILLPKEY